MVIGQNITRFSSPETQDWDMYMQKVHDKLVSLHAEIQFYTRLESAHRMLEIQGFVLVFLKLCPSLDGWKEI